MAPPARAKPRAQRKIPVRAALSAMTIITGASRSSGAPPAISRSISAPISDAVIAAVAPSGPPMAKGSELRADTMAAATALVRKVAAMP